jgi:DMSO/TMAO reductase YedYZ molybdopterin-dependent catalytic subunit
MGGHTVAIDLFGRREREERLKYGDRLPPGQKLTDGWPVLHYGAIPRFDPTTWKFQVVGMVEEPVSWNWDEFRALPNVDITCDIHCVTHWSKFDTVFTGVPFREVLARVKPLPNAKFVMVHSYGGYTTNVPLEELDDEDVLFSWQESHQNLAPEHGWPLRLVVPKLYFWKSAKWVRGLEFMDRNRPGFWEMYGYHIHGDPWTEERYS